eukprot:11161334-Lingulodinium_polyedra.AAC.1
MRMRRAPRHKEANRAARSWRCPWWSQRHAADKASNCSPANVARGGRTGGHQTAFSLVVNF